MQVKMTTTKLLLIALLFFSFISMPRAEFSESELSDLFTTKKQRTKIDAVRFGKPVPASVKPKVKKKVKNRKVKVSGYIQKGDGSSIVWLNGRNTLNGTKVGNVKVKRISTKNNKVSLNVDGKAVQLKPGEVWTETKGVSDPVK